MSPAQGQLIQNGGPDLTKPIHAYNIFLGPTWTATDKSLLATFMQNIGGSAWWGILKQYGVTSTVSLAQTLTASSGNLNGDAAIAAEITKVLKANKLTADPTAIYFLYVPNNMVVTSDSGGATVGGSNANACGFHNSLTLQSGVTIVYAVISNGGAGCYMVANNYYYLDYPYSPNGDPIIDSVVNIGKPANAGESSGSSNRA